MEIRDHSLSSEHSLFLTTLRAEGYLEININNLLQVFQTVSCGVPRKDQVNDITCDMELSVRQKLCLACVASYLLMDMLKLASLMLQKRGLKFLHFPA